MRITEILTEAWSQKYKSSINCSHPRGFSQKAHCAGKKKHNESVEMEMVCESCGMCQTHGNHMMEVKQRLDAKCWKGKHKEGTKIKGGVGVNNCVPNESVEQGVAEGLDQDLPSVLYHATYKPRLKSIKLKGLGAGGKRNWEDSQHGVVYLALDPNVAESYAETSDMIPEEWLDQIVILKISTAGLDPNKFGIDSNVQDNSGDTVEYHGVIPVSNISLYKQGVAEDLDAQFDAIEEMVEAFAQHHGVDAEQIWEDFDSVDDAELLDESAAWHRKAGKNKNGGLNAKGVASYRAEHPGSKLQTAVTTKPSKLKKGSKAAKRRKSFCARMSGVKGPMKKPNGKPTRKALALRKWNC